MKNSKNPDISTGDSICENSSYEKVQKWCEEVEAELRESLTMGKWRELAEKTYKDLQLRKVKKEKQLEHDIKAVTYRHKKMSRAIQNKGKS